MERVLAAGLLAMVISILVGPKFIAFLRRNEFGQMIREEGPAGHAVKQGTPTAGGVMIVFAMTVPFLALSHWTAEGLTVFGVTIACAAIGFVDDYIKVHHRRSLALAFYVFLFLILAGAANGANLTDGIDGLAIGVGIIALLTFTAMNVFTYIRSSQVAPEQDLAALDQAILGASLIGGAIGFLWYNAFPAEVFMGDTGSMAIGGALGGFAIMSQSELLLVLIGGIFVIEALSVILQVLSFRYWGRRIFLMTPIHHHFEMKAWSETKIMVRFWIMAAILCGGAFALYYQYLRGFRPDLFAP